MGRHAEGAVPHPQEAPLKISVSLAYSISEPLTYEVAAGTTGMRHGARVLVPLGRHVALGWVVGLDSPYSGRLKNIIGIVDDPFYPDAALLEFARQAGAAYFTSAGSLLDHCLPPSQKNPKNLRLESGGRVCRMTEFSAEELERLAAADPLRFFFKNSSNASIPETPVLLKGDSPSPHLLLGPQRDVKYRAACEQVLAGGGSVILVVPDNATAHYWQSVIPGIDPFHSGLKTAVREKTWLQFQQGKRGIVCGGISALALPLPRPGLLIIDRAASSLYQRGGASPFRADHLAEIRAGTAGVPLLRGADSHSCTTYMKRESASPDDQRRDRGISCQVHMLKGKERGIPEEIVDLVRQNYLAGKKTLVLVNRIQPAVHLFCAPCRRLATCPRCGGVLQVDEGQRVSCRRCSYHKETLTGCPRCGKSLEPLHDISIDSLSRAVTRVSSEGAVLPLTAAEFKTPQPTVDAAREHPIVIATLAALSPYFAGMFAAAIWIKPESFFNMEDFNAAEMIHASGAEIAGTLVPGGELHVFSVFHFHYALQYLMDEARFFERELKYRQWFILPPFASMYLLELKGTSLRSLAAAMRDLNRKYKDDLQIKRIFLPSRRPLRGTFRGILELHTTAEKIARAGLHKIKRSHLQLTAG